SAIRTGEERRFPDTGRNEGCCTCLAESNQEVAAAEVPEFERLSRTAQSCFSWIIPRGSEPTLPAQSGQGAPRLRYMLRFAVHLHKRNGILPRQSRHGSGPIHVCEKRKQQLWLTALRLMIEMWSRW